MSERALTAGVRNTNRWHDIFHLLGKYFVIKFVQHSSCNIKITLKGNGKIQKGMRECPKEI